MNYNHNPLSFENDELPKIPLTELDPALVGKIDELKEQLISLSKLTCDNDASAARQAVKHGIKQTSRIIRVRLGAPELCPPELSRYIVDLFRKAANALPTIGDPGIEIERKFMFERADLIEADIPRDLTRRFEI